MGLGNWHTTWKKRELYGERNDRIRNRNLGYTKFHAGIPKIDAAFQESQLVLQKSALEVQKAALTAQYAAVWVAGAVGFAQCALIGVGLWFMRRAAIARDKALDILMKRAEDQGLALLTLIERTAR